MSANAGRTSARALRLQDVAEAAGVSIATASRSLSGAARRQRGGRRAGARGAPDRWATSPTCTPAASPPALARRSAWSSTRSATPTSPRSPAACSASPRAAGLTVQICHSGRDPERELEQIRMLVANRVGAIIIAGSGFVDPADQAGAKADLQAFRAQRRPGRRDRPAPPGRRRRAARQPRRRYGRGRAPARPGPPPDRRRRRLASGSPRSPTGWPASRRRIARGRAVASPTSRSSRPSSPGTAGSRPPRRSSPSTPT